MERFILQALQDRDYTEFRSTKSQVFTNRKALGGKQYVRQVPLGDTIYETMRKADAIGDKEILDWWYQRKNAHRLTYDQKRDVWLIDNEFTFENPRQAVKAAIAAEKEK